MEIRFSPVPSELTVPKRIPKRQKLNIKIETNSCPFVFFLSTSLNCGGLTSFVWSGFAGEGTGGAGIFDFIVGTTVGDDFISAGGIGSGTPTASGTYTIVATPEAATYSLMLVGCLTILIFSGHRETSLCRPNPRDTRSRTGKRLENSQVSEDGRSISGH
jgi:hypothetical protein